MADSGRTGPFSSRAREFAAVDSLPRAANPYNDFPPGPVARGGQILNRDNYVHKAGRSAFGKARWRPGGKSAVADR
jgi:hypothetical protein